jgi:ribonuclease BN (tRNA processing enzyme)
MNRRDLLRAGAALALPTSRAQPAVRGHSRTRLILLGTAGGPRPRQSRFPSAQVVLVDDTPYVVDCGNGVARQLVAAEVPLRAIRHVFITHHHSDHNADYGNLLLLAWTAGLQTPVDCWGPGPLIRMTAQFLALNAEDVEARTADEGRVPLAPLLRPHDLDRAGVVLDDGKVRVTAAVVDHPPFKTALAYRFDTPDRSIVISGDTKRSDTLVRLAQGADVLVHEAIYPAAVDRLIANVSNASTLKQSILGHHTAVEDVGRVAEAAGVKTLVLSHLVPAEDPAVTDAMWVEGARAHFRGRIIVGRDLLKV